MKKIIFIPKSAEAEMVVNKPLPSKNYMPDWYKKMPAFYDKNNKINDLSEGHVTVKMCVPFGDSYSMGYIQETWCDIFISFNDDGTIKYQYAGGSPIIMGHRENYSHLPPQEFYKW